MPTSPPLETLAPHPLISAGDPQSVILAPAVALGFGAAALMWTTWFFTHIPWVQIPNALQLGLVLLVWFLSLAVGCRWVDRRRAIPVGAAAGTVTSIVSLLLLGALLNSDAGGEKPAAAIIVAGFLALGAVIGTLAGGCARVLGEGGRELDWRSMFAKVIVAWAAPLLFVGGLVTSTNSGMAVPDWPTTFEANMFLYPLGSAPTNVFLEHSHRLFGFMLGLTALINLVWTLRSETRRDLKWWALGIGLAILSQAVLGGLRVRLGNADAAEDNRWWSMVHGVSAQLIFALIVAFAVKVSPTYKFAPPDPSAAGVFRLRLFATAALHATFLQMIFGAMYRHTRSTHSLWAHAAFAILVVIFTVLAGFLAVGQRSQIDSSSPALARLKRLVAMGGNWQLAVVAFQFAIGWVIFAVGSKELTAASIGEALLRTSHQANGALLVAVSTLIYVCARRLAPRADTAEGLRTTPNVAQLTQSK